MSYRRSCDKRLSRQQTVSSKHKFFKLPLVEVSAHYSTTSMLGQDNNVSTACQGSTLCSRIVELDSYYDTRYKVKKIEESTQIAKVGWPTVGKWLSTWSALCRHIYRPSVGSANRHAVATTVGIRLAQQRYRQTNCLSIAGPVCLPNNGPTLHISPVSVGIYIGSLLGAQSGPQSMQRLANGWPINVIVDLTVVG